MVKKDKSIKIGIIGVGYLGSFHVEQLKGIPELTIIGMYDNDPKQANKMSKFHNINLYTSLKEILNECDAVSIATPTSNHYSIANQALNLNCHIFIEKPITDNIYHAQLLLDKAKKLNKIIQVGHIERFNPAFNAFKNSNIQLQFIESHRLTKFNPRGNDVPVILDLMIHDLDIILSLVKSDIKIINANGVKVVSSTIDIANARIEFNNGCVANLTSSRISQKNLRKMRLFQKKDYITIDFMKGILEEYKVCNKSQIPKVDDQIIELKGEKNKYILYSRPIISKHNALKEEFIHFANSIKNKRQPETDGYSAAEALKLALKIQEIIDQ